MDASSIERVERFRSGIEQMTGSAAPPIGLAVSGGADSLALLLLAKAALPGLVRAATVDHGLRPESAAEAEHVATICADLGVPHETLRVEVSDQGNLQAAARQARYEALGAWLARHGLPFLATGHHLDDLAETFLMRLSRGHGARGLAGMRVQSRLPVEKEDAILLRPLLGWRRDELAQLVEKAGIVPVQDPSNADDRFERVRVRKQLAEAGWLDPVAIAGSAARLADADEALAWAAAAHWDAAVRAERDLILYTPAAAPREIRRRAVEQILAALGSEGKARGRELDRLLDVLEAGGIATLAGVRCSGGVEWRFESAPPRRLR